MLFRWQQSLGRPPPYAVLLPLRRSSGQGIFPGLGVASGVLPGRSGRPLRSFSCLDAGIRELGEFQGTRIQVSKRGSPYLRRALWYCTQAAKRFDLNFHVFYQRKLQEGKHPKVATLALMRKLMVTIYYIWRSGKSYTLLPAVKTGGLSRLPTGPERSGRF
ncbi:transposase [Gelria sp. Kuro-4]|uniref:transposase n=1 Tax=Gelria sp. Kuro-4 TaxID=2796927 RepID=UPI00351D73D1